MGRQFLALGATERRRVKLVAIKDLRHETQARQEECFTLVFEPANGRKLIDGIYRLHRTGAHTSDLFLSGVGTGITMQAVINRIPAT